MAHELAGLLDEITAAYGVVLDGEPVRGDASSDVARVMLADRLASAIHHARPHPAKPRANPDAVVPADWTALPELAQGTASDPIADTARLLAWARAGGAELDAIEIRTTPDGYRTVFATRDFAEDERVMVIPRGLFFELDHAQASPVGQAIAAIGCELSTDRTAFAVALVAELRDPASRLAPFLAVLPRRLAGFPVFHGSAALAPIAGSPVISGAVWAHRTMRADFEQLAGPLAPVLTLTLAELAWARCAMSSRTFSVTIDGVTGSALVPIADCCDHGSANVTWHYDDRAGGLVFTAGRALARGEELRNSYGIKSNARMLVNYGFCVADNPADIARIELCRAPLDVRGDLIARLLWDRPLGAPWEVQLAHQLDRDAQLAFSQARLAVAPERELLAAVERGVIAKSGVGWISERNELAAIAAIADGARARLAERDRQPTAIDRETPFGQAIALLLAGERAVLENVIAFTAQAAAIVPGATRWDLERRGKTGGISLLAQYVRKLAELMR